MELLLDNIVPFGYFVALMAVICYSYTVGSKGQQIVTSSLFLLWVVNMSFVALSGNYTPEGFFGVGDFVLFMLLWYSARGDWGQKSVAMWFIPMFFGHLSFVLIEPQTYVVQYNYWLFLTVLSWGQLINVILWFIQDSHSDSTSNATMGNDKYCGGGVE